MNLIAWREQFTIGLPEVDHEHREMIAAINRLHGALGPGTDAADVADSLGGIHAGISAHFALEEKSMAALGYGDYLLHKADHERLLDEILASVSAHFALEEKVMRARHYDVLAGHKADHERLLDELRDLMDEQTGGAALDEAAFSARLAEWFSAHFRTQDARLHRFLAR